MTKRFNTKDSFEQVYLRYNQAMRDFKNVTSKDLRDPEFIKICKYAAGKCYYGNESFLLTNGYDLDDISSLATIFGACYLGYQDKTVAYDKRRSNLMMIAYILQRINRFMSWTSAKFQSSEIVSRVSDTVGMSLYSDNSTTVDDTVMYGIEDTKSDMDVLMDLLEESEECTNKIRKKKVDENISKLKSKISTARSESKATDTLNKISIKENPAKYAESLAWYAATKHVSYDVRRAARRYCVKYNIDYKTMITDLIAKSDYDKSNFDLK